MNSVRSLRNEVLLWERRVLLELAPQKDKVSQRPKNSRTNIHIYISGWSQERRRTCAKNVDRDCARVTSWQLQLPLIQPVRHISLLFTTLTVNFAKSLPDNASSYIHLSRSICFCTPKARPNPFILEHWQLSFLFCRNCEELLKVNSAVIKKTPFYFLVCFQTFWSKRFETCQHENRGFRGKVVPDHTCWNWNYKLSSQNLFSYLSSSSTLFVSISNAWEPTNNIGQALIVSNITVYLPFLSPPVRKQTS